MLCCAPAIGPKTARPEADRHAAAVGSGAWTHQNTDSDPPKIRRSRQ